MNRRQKLVLKHFLDNEEAVIGRLKSVYGKSLDDINEKVKNLTFSIGKLQEEYDWLDPDDPERAKVKSMIQSKIYQKQYQEQLQRQIDGVFSKMKTQQYTTVSSYLDECYEDGFIGSLFDAHGQGVPITTPINQESMVRAVQLDSKISKGLYTRLGEDVDLLKKKITAQVSRSIATGMTYQQTAQALSGYTRIGFNNAVRIARTEGHRIQCQSAMDAMTDAKDRGADVLKQWDATLDGKTRESHAMVDMEIRELDKPFSNGLMFPGDPSGKASEVINCRCSIDQRASWEFEGDDKSFTKFNNFTGQIEEFESPQAYDEFKKAFFSPENRSYMNYVQEMEGKYGTKDFPKLLGKMSDVEYKRYSDLLKRNPLYNEDAPNVVDIPTLRTELIAITRKINFNKREIAHAKQMLYHGMDKDAVDKRVAELQSELDALEIERKTKGKIFIENRNTTFKVSTDNDEFVSLVLDLDLRVGGYNEVMELTSSRSAEEIIKAIAGGDLTQGSCASVGLGYIGQKSGWDVLDFRDGDSREWFGGKAEKLRIWNALGIPYITEDSAKSNLTNGKRILAKMQPGKEYYLSVGRHAAVVRRDEDGVLQYLELQSSRGNGWVSFGDVGETLKWRFGCTSSTHYYSTAYLTDVDNVVGNNQFRTILGYINTSESAQRKGSSGTIK